MTIAVAAAGTGGHVLPALAIAGEMAAAGVSRDDIVFFGGDRYEAEAVPSAGFPFVGFPLVKLDRTPALRHARIPLVVWRTAGAMAAEMRARRVRAVLGMSGYVTVPAALAARRAGLPFFLQEQNAGPGLASRFAARRAVRTFLGLPGPAERLPRSEVVGNPLRPEFGGFDREALRSEGRSRYDAEPGTAVLGVLGGSLGARILNEATARLADTWDGGAITIVHLSGAAAAEDMQRLAGGSPLPWRCLASEERMDLFYAAADLVVCRAGAMTVSELAATGTPSVLVPLSPVGQDLNARVLADRGGARVLPEAEIGALDGLVRGLLADEGRRAAMSAAARSLGRPGAAGLIASAVVEAARG